MPMIDVTAARRTFGDKPALTKALAEAMMRWEKVPPIDFFSANTAAFIHELPADSLSKAVGTRTTSGSKSSRRSGSSTGTRSSAWSGR
jgi:hypothetical protein